jgi:cytochrome c-type biogenesis protein
LSDQVTLLAAFVAGVLSFISPCVLPLIPGYVSFVSGVSLDEMRGGSGALSSSRRQVLITSLFFVLGFSLVFIALGATASAVGKFLLTNQALFAAVAGTLLIILGLHTMGVFRISWLETDTRVHTQKKPAGPLGAVIVGIAFAFGWTPCIGPILGGMMTLAASKQTVWEGVRLLAIYSLGLGIPFLLTSVAINQFFAASARIRKHYRAIELVSGSLLIAIGLLIFTGRLTVIVQYLTPYLPEWLQTI